MCIKSFLKFTNKCLPCICKYLIFKEDRQWDKWNRSIKALVHTHDCEEIFDPTYTPNGADEEDNFIEKQKFIYSVFEDKVLTNTLLLMHKV